MTVTFVLSPTLTAYVQSNMWSLWTSWYESRYCVANGVIVETGDHVPPPPPHTQQVQPLQVSVVFVCGAYGRDYKPAVFVRFAVSVTMSSCCRSCACPVPRSGVAIVCVLALASCTGLARRVPINYVLLLVFTLAESYIVAAVSTLYEVESVVLAIGMTAAITTGLTLFALQVRMCVRVLVLPLS